MVFYRHVTSADEIEEAGEYLADHFSRNQPMFLSEFIP
jgi:hypothetical protein